MMVTKLTCPGCGKVFEQDMSVSPVVCPACQMEYVEVVDKPEEVTAPSTIGTKD